MDLSYHQDRIIGNFAKWRDRQDDRNSEAGTDREEIGALIELTGINKKALSFGRALFKMDEDKREDVLRSLRPLLEVLEAHWNGNKTPDMFQAVEPVPPSYTDTFDPKSDDPEIQADSEDFEKALASA